MNTEVNVFKFYIGRRECLEIRNNDSIGKYGVRTWEWRMNMRRDPSPPMKGIHPENDLDEEYNDDDYLEN